ncbi:pup--protein ligase [Mycobacterium kansasii]|uniref:Pup--protein ligase n=1 Tax=Mycobacterium kansasii TaxID=1768 RepID=A0A1V3X3X9_MYCKA|nr:pup--protein ligase [Mycobacterium kansasii]
MQRRIMGIETEFGVTCTFHGHRRLSPDEVARYLFRRVVSWGRSSNVFLRNGARLYLDVGSHPEYATAECDSLVQLVTHDRAGEWVLEDLLIDAEQRLADEGIGGDIYLFKNNTDSAGNSYGCHENYLIVRAGEFSRISDVLLPFLVTRQLICGAGKVLQTPKAATFCLSQRAEHIWEGVSSATTRSRPIINTRDEPHADAEKYRRLHVIVGDSNMCETTTMLKVGTAALVLEMIEAGWRSVIFPWTTRSAPSARSATTSPVAGRCGWPGGARPARWTSSASITPAPSTIYRTGSQTRRSSRSSTCGGASSTRSRARTSPRWTPRSTG